MHSSFALTELPYPKDLPTSLNTGSLDSFFNCPPTEHQDALRRWFHQLIDISSNPALSTYSRLVASNANTGSLPTLRPSLATLGSFTAPDRDHNNFANSAQFINKNLQDQGIDWRTTSGRSGQLGLQTSESIQRELGEQTKLENLPPPMPPGISQYSTPLEFQKVIENLSKTEIPVNGFAQSTGTGYTPTAQNSLLPSDNCAAWLNVLLSVHKTLLSMTQVELTKSLQGTLGNVSRQPTEEGSCLETLRQLNILRQSMESANNHSVGMSSINPSTQETASVAESQLQSLLCQLYRINSAPLCDNGHTNTVMNQNEDDLQNGLSLTVKPELPSASHSHVSHLKLPVTDLSQLRENYLLPGALHRHHSASGDGKHADDEDMETEEAEDLTVHETFRSSPDTADGAKGSHGCPTESPKKVRIDLEGGYRKGNRQNHSSHRSSFRLSQFLRHLLNRSDCNPHLICWVDQAQNTFKLVNSSAVARLWGLHKQKPNMNYETMGRAMRYYYAQNILKKVKGQRLVYQFLQDPVPTSSGCKRSENSANTSPTNSVN